ncbi:MAG: hypothetical protein HFE79_13920 [Ruminiclostridium sp.]|nr:hypothetical protein [Ruminiclostridium sp.]
MPKIRKTKIKKMKTCSSCGRELPLSTGFYSTKSPLFAVDGKINICKECFIGNALNDEIGEIDEVKFKNLLRKTDFPFYRDNLQSAANQYAKEHGYVSEDDVKYHGSDIIKLYMKNVNSLRQLNSKTFEDSEKDGFIQKGSTVVKKGEGNVQVLSSAADKQIEKQFLNQDNFELTEEIVQLFGEGYSKDEYRKMHKKYEKLKLNYSLQTNLHQEALATYVRFKVKEENATASGNVDEAKKWYDAAQNAAEKAKLTPKQLTQADLQNGINSFSEIFKAVEQAVDVVPILPKFKFAPNDACDFIIWCYINYARDLQGLPHCEYEDVYKFYDKKKEEFISQYGDPYGIFDEDPSKKIRENIQKFITLPKDYEDGDG